MEQWSKQQRSFAVKAFYQSGSYAAAQRRFRKNFQINRNKPVPSVNSIKLWVTNFEAIGETRSRRGGSARSVRTPANIDRVRVAVERSPRRSARRQSAALGMANTSVRRILRLDLHHHPYKIQVVQAMNENDFAARRRFCQTLLDMFDENEDLVHNLWMSDEAHFHLHSSKVTVWCAMSSLGIIGPYFFENDREQAVTVNAQRYSEMLHSFVIPQLRQHGMNNETLFQQDGATSHTARVSMNVLNNVFPNRVISRNGAISWPPRSPDLTVCDFFLWGYLKSKVFEQRPPTLGELKRRIRLEIERIPQRMLRDAMGCFRNRLQECLNREGHHLTGVNFKQ
uniref:DUF4817 domain-containing protein n=1 Tax=Leptobrachium leishanense TaxID=445787 RepID=A0A8C5MM42_9ANUR